jgi:elongation factor Ts
MAIDAKTINELRNMTGAGIVDCKKTLEETGGDIAKAADILRRKGMAKAAKREDRSTKAGLIYAYIHGEGRVGALVEVQCETDFVARTDQFKAFVHDVAMQVAAMNPLYLGPESVSAEVLEKEKEIYAAEFAGSSKPKEVIDKIVCGKLEKFYSETCLLNQAFIKDEDKTVGELLKELTAKTGEKIVLKRFVRFALAEAAVC